MSNRFRRVLPIVCSIVAVLVVGQTALGYVETKTTGTVGAHSLSDTTGSPAAICVYKPSPIANVTQLKHIDVNAPQVKAIAGMGTETVGWRFVIQRTRFGITPHWKRIYRSPIWKASTDSAHDASFSQEGANVVVPHPYATGGYGFRVIVKLYWYKANGTTVKGSTSGRLEWYVISHGTNPGPFQDACSDYDD